MITNACVVLHAFVEHQPRLLLRAIAHGIPVIATPAWGIPAQPGVSIIQAGDSTGLALALSAALEAPMQQAPPLLAR